MPDTQSALAAAEQLLPELLKSLPLAFAIFVGGLLANFIFGRLIGMLGRRTHLNDKDLSPVRRIIKWAVMLVTLVLILGVFGLNLGGVWAVLSTILAMIAIGFVAVWSVLSNTLCTVIILLFRPFAIGDDIEFAGEPVKGRVIDLNFIFTTLRTDDGATMQIPNNLFFQKVIKRRQGNYVISLAAQLNSPTPAEPEPAHPNP